jgi:hypothetical protein
VETGIVNDALEQFIVEDMIPSEVISNIANKLISELLVSETETLSIADTAVDQM